MFTKLPAALSIVLVLAFLFAPIVFASEGDLASKVDKTNAFIEREVNKAIADADRLLSDYLARIDEINSIYNEGGMSPAEMTYAVNQCAADFEAGLDKIASKLIEKTDRKANVLLTKAEKDSIDIAVEYMQVDLAGRIYTVDPLRIVGN